MTTPPAAPGPLAGIRVVDVTTVVMGPLATQTLGDLGADVIKVEPLEGDRSRAIGGGPHPELSGIALNLHRNKRSITMDLKQEEARAAFLAVLDTADVFVTNLRPSALASMGLAYDDVAAGRERLVYCQAQGFRSGTEDANRPAYDDIIQAATGLPWLNTKVLGVTHFVPTLIADKVAGLTIVQSVLAGLYHRERTGLGQRIEVPMFDTLLAFNLVEHLSRGAIEGEAAGYTRITSSYRRPQQTADGYVSIQPYTDKHWRSLYTAIGAGDRLADPAYRDHASRTLHADQIYRELAELVRDRTSAEWLALCAELDVPAGPVPSIDDIVTDPTLHRGVLRPAEHPVVGPYREIRPPALLGGSPASVRRPAPMLGEHTAEILAEVGFGTAEVDRLVAMGAVSRPGGREVDKV